MFCSNNNIFFFFIHSLPCCESWFTKNCINKAKALSFFLFMQKNKAIERGNISLFRHVWFYIQKEYKRKGWSFNFWLVEIYKMNPQVKNFFKRSFTHPEVLPLMAIVGTALSAASYVGYRQLHSSGVELHHKTHNYAR